MTKISGVWAWNPLKGKHELVTNEYAFEEAKRNITVKFPHWKSGFDFLINEYEILPTINRLDPSITLRDKDRPILSSAVEYECDYLVTGDKRDFGHLFGQVIGKTKVVTPAQLAEDLL